VGGVLSRPIRKTGGRFAKHLSNKSADIVLYVRRNKEKNKGDAKKEGKRTKRGSEEREDSVQCAATDAGYIEEEKRTQGHEEVPCTCNFTSLLSTALLSSPALFVPLVPVVIMVVIVTVSLN
jgi:hypothetical protein